MNIQLNVTSLLIPLVFSNSFISVLIIRIVICNKTDFFTSYMYINQTSIIMREDNRTVMLMHLSQLLDFITGVGGLIVPLIIWLVKKDEIYALDKHGKAVINFQLSMILLGIVAIPLILLLGLGLVILFAIPFVIGIFAILNAIKASNGEHPYYPLTIQFLK